MSDNDRMNHAKQTEDMATKRLRTLFGKPRAGKQFREFLKATFNESLFPFTAWLDNVERGVFFPPTQTAFGLIDLFSNSYESVYGVDIIARILDFDHFEAIVKKGRLTACNYMVGEPFHSSPGMGIVTCILKDSPYWAVRFYTNEPDTMERLKKFYYSLPRSVLLFQEELLFPDSGRWPSQWEITTDWMHEVWERINPNHTEELNANMKLITEDITLNQLGEVNLPFLTNHLFRLVDESLTQHEDPSRVKRSFKTPVGEFHLSNDDNDMKLVINRAFSVLDDEVEVPEGNPYGQVVPYQIVFELYRLEPTKSTAYHTLVFKEPDEKKKKQLIQQPDTAELIRVRASELTDSMDVFFVEGNMLFDMDLAEEREKLLDAIEREKPTMSKYLLTQFTNASMSNATIADKTLTFSIQSKFYGFVVKEPSFTFEHSAGRLPDNATITTFTLTVGRALGQIAMVEAVIDYAEGQDRKHGTITVTWNRTEENQIPPLLVRHEGSKQIPWQEFEMKELS